MVVIVFCNYKCQLLRMDLCDALPHIHRAVQRSEEVNAQCDKLASVMSLFSTSDGQKLRHSASTFIELN